MNKILKVALWSFAAVLAFAVMLFCISVNVLFTSQRITPIVNDILPEFFTCEAKVESVDLTYFSTFPNLEVHLQGMTLVNPVADAPTDTLLRIGRIDLDFNLRTFLYQKQLILDELRIADGHVSLFTSADGSPNYDVLAEMEETDEALPLGLQLLRIDRVGVEAFDICCIDRKQQMEAYVAPLALRVDSPIAYPTESVDLTLSVRTGRLCYRDSSRVDLAMSRWGVEDLHLVYTDAAPRLDGLVMTLDSLRMEADGGLPPMSLAMRGASLSLPEVSLTGGNVSLPQGVAATCEGLRFAADNPDSPLALDMQRATLAFPQLSLHEGYGLSYLADVASVCLMTDEHLLDGQSVGLQGTLSVDSALSHVRLEESVWQLGAERMLLDADVRLVDDAPRALDVRLVVGPSTFDRLLALLPASAQGALDGIDLHGTLAAAKAQLSVEIGGQDSLRIRSFDVATCLQDLSYAEGETMWAKAGQLDFSMRFPTLHEDYEQEVLIETQLQAADARMRAVDSSHVELLTPQFALHGFQSGQILEDGASLPLVLIDDISSSHVRAYLDSLSVDVQQLHAELTLTEEPDDGVKYYKATVDGQEFEAAAGLSLSAVGDAFQLETSSIYDPEQQDLLLRYNPGFNMTVYNGNVEVSGLPHSFEFPFVDFDFNPLKCKIRKGDIYYGKSRLALEGTINNLRGFLLREGPLRVDLSLKSPFIDVFELRDLIDGIGTENASAETEESEMGSYLAGTFGSLQPTLADSTGEHPFMVPLGIELSLNTDVESAKVGTLRFDNLGGKVLISDGEMKFEDLGFSSEAARMILNSTYKSSRPDNLFLCADFHLFDVQIANLVNLVPGIDSIMPMLLSFDGQGEFHLSAETNLTADYAPKFSTLKAAALFEGADLGLLDDETFGKMSRYLLFSKDTRNRIDSLNVAFTVNRRRMTLYPMRIGMDRYEAVVSGEHTLTNDMLYDYHVSLVKAPLVGGLVGVDVAGDMSHPDDFRLKLARCQYAHLQNPARRSAMLTRLIEKKNNIASEVRRIKR